jgi:hypothetical protein
LLWEEERMGAPGRVAVAVWVPAMRLRPGRGDLGSDEDDQLQGGYDLQLGFGTQILFLFSGVAIDLAT